MALDQEFPASFTVFEIPADSVQVLLSGFSLRNVPNDYQHLIGRTRCNSRLEISHFASWHRQPVLYLLWYSGRQGFPDGSYEAIRYGRFEVVLNAPSDKLLGWQHENARIRSVHIQNSGIAPYADYRIGKSFYKGVVVALVTHGRGLLPYLGPIPF